MLLVLAKVILFMVLFAIGMWIVYRASEVAERNNVLILLGGALFMIAGLVIVFTIIAA